MSTLQQKKSSKKGGESPHHRPRPVPEKLGHLIEMVNALPFERLMSPESLKDDLESDLEDEGGRDNIFFDTYLNELVVNHLDKFEVPELVSSYIRAGKPRKIKYPDPDGGAFGRYAQLCSANIRLRRIARLVKKPMSDRLVDQYISYTYSGLPDLRSIVLDSIDEKGYVQINKDLFAEAVEDEEVEAARIRECPICKAIFWAGYITQKCCSPTCANTFRVHRYRYKTKEEKAAYLHRRMNREAKRLKEAQEKARSIKKVTQETETK